MSRHPPGSSRFAPALTQCLGKRAGHLHLADSELTGDLCLCQVLVEAKLDGPPGIERQPLGQPAEEPAILGREQAGIIERRGAHGGGLIARGWPVQGTRDSPDR
jgi:hypothetical protein